jgi:hypothetical protein
MPPADRPWWRWPEDRRRGLVPWFIVLRRLLFLPLFAVALALGWLAVLGANGLREARQWWIDAT